jgi:hypothetical protein
MGLAYFVCFVTFKWYRIRTGEEMSWTITTTFSNANPLRPDDGLEWNGLVVDTQEEANEWWRTRTRTYTPVRRTHVMTDPNGNVVKVEFT